MQQTEKNKQKKLTIKFKKAVDCLISAVGSVFFAGRVAANLHAGVGVRALGKDIVLVGNAVALGTSCLEFSA